MFQTKFKTIFSKRATIKFVRIKYLNFVVGGDCNMHVAISRVPVVCSAVIHVLLFVYVFIIAVIF